MRLPCGLAEALAGRPRTSRIRTCGGHRRDLSTGSQVHRAPRRRPRVGPSPHGAESRGRRARTESARELVGAPAWESVLWIDASRAIKRRCPRLSSHWWQGHVRTSKALARDHSLGALGRRRSARVDSRASYDLRCSSCVSDTRSALDAFVRTLRRCKAHDGRGAESNWPRRVACRPDLVAPRQLTCAAADRCRWFAVRGAR